MCPLWGALRGLLGAALWEKASFRLILYIKYSTLRALAHFSAAPLSSPLLSSALFYSALDCEH